MQISHQTQNNTAAYGFSESLMAQTQFQLQAVNSSQSRPGSVSDQISLSPGALAGSRTSDATDPMSSLLGVMQSILQQVLGVSMNTVAATGKPDAVSGSTAGSDTSQRGPDSSLDQLTSSILSALQGDDASQSAKSGGNQDSLLSALSNMGRSVESDALSLFNNLSAQNQSMMNGLLGSAVSQGASGSYLSQVSVAESQHFSFAASGQLTTASGQRYQFSLQVDLEVDVAISSSQSGTFGPGNASQNSGGMQSLQLGAMAGLFSGASLSYPQPTLQSATQGKDKGKDKDEGSATSSAPTLASIGQQINSALASLILTPEQQDGKTKRQAQQQISALLQPAHRHHKHGQGKHQDVTTQTAAQTQAQADTTATQAKDLASNEA
ncbi:hypothetical protein THUN1379_30020 [Paludibacterium sp. THUN1379]|uniref:hypothetical protein n=1 Tax=Paludibacterium sp. THUN1379 TaxID=3112107 RepID=UPI00308B73A7|nr:hypothetical protein THUN1379_30020 [Paludibacterium sp. THUN1379]